MFIYLHGICNYYLHIIQIVIFNWIILASLVKCLTNKPTKLGSFGRIAKSVGDAISMWYTGEACRIEIPENVYSPAKITWAF